MPPGAFCPACSRRAAVRGTAGSPRISAVYAGRWIACGCGCEQADAAAKLADARPASTFTPPVVPKLSLGAGIGGALGAPGLAAGTPAVGGTKPSAGFAKAAKDERRKGAFRTQRAALPPTADASRLGAAGRGLVRSPRTVSLVGLGCIRRTVAAAAAQIARSPFPSPPPHLALFSTSPVTALPAVPGAFARIHTLARASAMRCDRARMRHS